MEERIQEKVLTIGCAYKPPRGGIARVIYCYDKYIFDRFNFVKVSDNKNKVYNFFLLVFAVFKYINKLIFDNKIKIIHIHSASYLSFVRSVIFLRIGKFFGKSVIMHIHGGGFRGYYFRNKKFVYKNLSLCDYVFTLSSEWQSFYKSIGIKRIKIIENIIPFPDKIDNPIDDNKIHLLFVGLIHERKGIFDLIDVLGEHKTEFEDKIVLHIGGNGDVSSLNSRIKSMGLEGFVKYEGWLEDDAKTELFNTCKILVLPSYIEGMPLSILEAMSYKLAILSTRVGGIPSIVKHKSNGLLVEAGNLKELYDALTIMVNDNELLEAMCNSAANRVEQYYPSSVNRRLTAFYKAILKNNQ